MNGMLIVGPEPEKGAKPEDKKKGPAMKEVCVPLSSLAEGDVNPEEGDAVQFDVTGKVSRIEGENAYVNVETVNGEALKNETEKEKPSERDEALQEFSKDQDY